MEEKGQESKWVRNRTFQRNIDGWWQWRGEEWLNLNQEENNFTETMDQIYNYRILSKAAPD